MYIGLYVSIVRVWYERQGVCVLIQVDATKRTLLAFILGVYSSKSASEMLSMDN